MIKQGSPHACAHTKALPRTWAAASQHCLPASTRAWAVAVARAEAEAVPVLPWVPPCAPAWALRFQQGEVGGGEVAGACGGVQAAKWAEQAQQRGPSHFQPH